MTRLFMRMALGVFIAIVLSIVIASQVTRHNLEDGLVRIFPKIFLGVNKLVDQRLSTVPQEKIFDELRQIKIDFPFPLDLLPPDHEAIPESVKRDLATRKLSGTNTDTSLTFYSSLLKDQYVLVCGPLPKIWQPTVTIRIIGLGLFSFVLLSLTLILGYPLGKRLRHLERVTEKFGKGQLDERVSISGKDGVDQLAGRFNQMADRIQLLLESQSNMLGAVSHELRTALSRIRFKLELLPSPAETIDQDNPITPIERDLDALTRLIDDLLLYHRVDTDESVVFDELEAQSFIKSVIETYKSENDPKIEIKMLADLSESIKLRGNSTFLRLALFNLLANGVRYALSRLHVNLQESEGNLFIIIENDGPPIPEEKWDLIFKPFFRLDTSRSRETGGTGLGLTIVKKVAEMHCGQVYVAQSDLGSTRFKLIIPCS